MINEQPLVSVISAALNAAEQLPHTLRSIAAQAGNLLLAAKVLAGCLPAPMGNRVADIYWRLSGRQELWSPR